MNMTVLIKKYTYGLLLIATTLVGLCYNFSNAENLNISLQQVGGSTGTGSLTLDHNSIYCFYASFNNTSRSVLIDFQGYNDKLPVSSTNVLCFSVGNSDNILEYEFVGGSYVNLIYYKVYSLGGCNYSGYVLETDITESYCTNKFSNLIDESDINQNYCVNNNLCPIIDQNYCVNNNLCPISQGTGEIQRSSLYINNIQHLGAGIIDITIPEEIEREYYNSDNEINIEITGYGYDQEKMQNIVNTQFTPPSTEDIENTIGKIADFLPLLAIMLLIVYSWWLIKKVF